MPAKRSNLCQFVQTLAITLTMVTFAFAQPAVDRAKRIATFDSLDANKDGQLEKSETPEQMQQNFARLDANNDGKISREEMLSQSARKRGKALPKRPGEVVAPAAHAERQPEQLQAGDVAPDFNLPLTNQAAQVELSKLLQEKPMVLVFGSISCAPFRAEVQQVEELFKKYSGKAHFLMVYIREAHPNSDIIVKDEKGTEVLKKFTQTDDATLRNEHAQTCQRTLNLSFPTVIDQVDNRVNKAYAGWPIRLVTIGRDGKIIDPGAQGPRGFDPAKLAQWLKTL